MGPDLDRLSCLVRGECDFLAESGDASAFWGELVGEDKNRTLWRGGGHVQFVWTEDVMGTPGRR